MYEVDPRGEGRREKTLTATSYFNVYTMFIHRHRQYCIITTPTSFLISRTNV
jgi:hypothetical protein